MTLNEIRERLVGTGFPVAYSHFKDTQTAPFICYMQTGTDNFDADNQAYFPVKRVRIELYTEIKDPSAEQKVETALSGLNWESQEVYIDSEEMYEISYEIEV